VLSLSSTIFEGDMAHIDCRYGIVVARFNDFITSNLLEGALRALAANGISTEEIPVVWVPGAFEMPLAAKHLAESGTIDAVIALGCVIRGGTPHFEFVAAEASRGLSRVQLDSGIPVAFGLLTTDNIEQALERAQLNKEAKLPSELERTKLGGAKIENKGGEAAVAAMEMISVLRKLDARIGG